MTDINITPGDERKIKYMQQMIEVGAYIASCLTGEPIDPEVVERAKHVDIGVINSISIQRGV